MTAPATVRLMVNSKRVLSAEDEQAIRNAMQVASAAQEGVRAAILTAVNHGASVRVLAEFTSMSTSTISRWKREARL
jgi:hypothetical protein